jgi:hypothetical protein
MPANSSDFVINHSTRTEQTQEIISAADRLDLQEILRQLDPYLQDYLQDHDVSELYPSETLEKLQEILEQLDSQLQKLALSQEASEQLIQEELQTLSQRWSLHNLKSFLVKLPQWSQSVLERLVPHWVWIPQLTQQVNNEYAVRIIKQLEQTSQLPPEVQYLPEETQIALKKLESNLQKMPQEEKQGYFSRLRSFIKIHPGIPIVSVLALRCNCNATIETEKCQLSCKFKYNSKGIKTDPASNTNKNKEQDEQRRDEQRRDEQK